MFTRIWRLLKKYYFKFIRTHGTPHQTALAVALGFFIGCVIPMGIWGQTAASIILAIRLGTNPGLTFAATWISNPYTVVVMYPVFCYVGSKLIGAGLTFAHIKEIFMNLIHHFSWSELLSVSSELAISYIIGALIFGIITGLLGYYLTYKFLKTHKDKKAARQAKKKKERIKWMKLIGRKKEVSSHRIQETLNERT